MKRLIILTALLFSACGSSNSNEPTSYTNAEPINQASVTTTKVGTFQSSSRNAETKEWFTATSGGVFRTYTSTQFKEGEKLYTQTTAVKGNVVRSIIVGEVKWWDIKL